MPTPPPQLPSEGILIGYSLEHERRTAPIGFVYGDAADRNAAAPTHLTPILHTGGGHLMTIAPTGAGKGVSCIVPTLLRFPGPVIVIDPKGENWAVTARRRRALGQTVVLLDPMGITGGETSSLNPLDLIDAGGSQSIDDASMLANLLGGGVERDDPRNLFWYQRGEALLTGLIQYVATEAPEERRNLSEVRRLLNLPNDEFVAFARANLQRAVDPDVRQLAGTLINPAEELIGSIVSMAQNSLGFLRGERLHDATARSAFDLDGITRGDPLSVFIVIPPDKLRSHQNLLRLWVGTLMAALMRRRAPVEHNTLFILDEAAQLGPLEQLRQAITLLRGYGLQTWSFWQDHSQLRNLYPLDWQTMYNNCRVHQAFGFATLQAAEAISQLTGFHDPLAALQLDGDEMLLSISGDETVIAQKPNYLTDPAFAGLFAENPFYSRIHAQPPAPRRTQRVYRRPRRQQGEDGTAGDAAAEDDAADHTGMEPATPPVEVPGDGVDAGSAGTLRVFAPSHDGPFIPAQLRPPGGLSPLPHTRFVAAGELTRLLDRIETHTPDRWDRYRTLARSLILAFDPSGPVLYDVCAPGCWPARALYIDFGSTLRRWTGGIEAILGLNNGRPPVLAGGAGHQFTRVWLHFTREGGARLDVVESDLELGYWTEFAEEAMQRFAPLVRPLEVERDDENRRIATGTALAGADLVAFRLRLEGLDAPVLEEVELIRESVRPVPGRVEPREGESWEIMPEPDRTDFLGHLDPATVRRADIEAPVLRRGVACYPDAELVRLAPGPGHRSTLWLWCGGRPVPITRDTLLDLNGIHLQLLGSDALADYAGIYCWLRFEDDYHVALLDRPADLFPLLDGLDLADHAEQLNDRWKPLTVESADGPTGVVAFTVLLNGDVGVLEATIESNGALTPVLRDSLLAGIPIDVDRLRAFVDFPVLRGAGR